jgi:hypothetical protein
MSTIQTQSSSSTVISTGRVAWNRLWLAGLITIVGSIIVNMLIRFIALALVPTLSSSMQLGMPAVVIVFTLVGTLGAVLVFALMNRFARNPIRTFRIVASVILVLSFIPDFLLGASEGIAHVIPLILMHIATGLICIGVLTGRRIRA